MEMSRITGALYFARARPHAGVCSKGRDARVEFAGARPFVSFCILRQFGDVQVCVARQAIVLTELGAISNVPLFPKPAGDFARRLPFDGQPRLDEILLL